MQVFLSILSLCAELLIFTLGSLLMGKTVGRFLPQGKGRLRRVSPYVLFAITFTMPTWIGDANPLFLFLPFVLVFHFCYDGAVLARLVTGTVFFELLIAWNMMVDSSSEWLDNPYGSQDFLNWILKLGMWFVLFLWVRRMILPNCPLQMSTRLWALAGLLSAAPLFAELAFSIWDFQPYDVESLRVSFVGMVYTILIFAFLSSLALLYALTVLARHEELERENQLLLIEEVYYEGLKREQNQVHTLRHDLRNHLTVLQGLLEREEKEKAKDYLLELTQSSALCGVKRICENELVNVVLSSKLEAMQQKEIRSDFAVQMPEKIGIADVDLCALLSNALDNAMEAAEKAEEKRVMLRIRTDKGMLMLRLENSGALSDESGSFETTKPDKKRHGFGLPRMREITQRYGGYLEATTSKGHFELTVCLPCENARGE